jgi:hypothetical protein
MRSQDMSDEEIARRGLQIYEQRLKPTLEQTHTGEQVAISVEDGDYEVAPTGAEADARLRSRHPDAVFALLEVGKPLLDWPWSRTDVLAGKP